MLLRHQAEARRHREHLPIVLIPPQRVVENGWERLPEWFCSASLWSTLEIAGSMASGMTLCWLVEDAMNRSPQDLLAEVLPELDWVKSAGGFDW